ncbi:hypothetical protein FALBO_17209 [Fusarium albosuccineum]|uniref:Uncharacterized protein n=1 Tax=Fusarium albosuccineum TaxID=1237068 RepID=A0A8H4NUM4_9HYPO|nr:hypothetical protein FALBO_17209 [Fusarium albosuccineum]
MELTEPVSTRSMLQCLDLPEPYPQGIHPHGRPLRVTETPRHDQTICPFPIESIRGSTTDTSPCLALTYMHTTSYQPCPVHPCSLRLSPFVAGALSHGYRSATGAAPGFRSTRRSITGSRAWVGSSLAYEGVNFPRPNPIHPHSPPRCLHRSYSILAAPASQPPPQDLPRPASPVPGAHRDPQEPAATPVPHLCQPFQCFGGRFGS